MEAKCLRRNPIPANAVGMKVALVFYYEKKKKKEKPYHDTALDIEVSKDIEISAGKAGSIVLSMKGDSIAIPSSIMDIARAKETGIVSALMTDRYCYVVFPEYWPSSFEYKMWCIDRRSGEINWSTEVFGPVDGLSTSGFQQSPHYVSIVAKQGKVYVFGGTPESMYIEAFSAETGKGVFRFCTLY